MTTQTPRPLSELTDQWVTPLDAQPALLVDWWSFGRVDHTKANGEIITGIVAVELTRAGPPRLIFVQGDPQVRTMATMMLGPHEGQFGVEAERAAKLAQAIVDGSGVRISYQGKNDPEPRERRLDALIPTKDGRSVFARAGHLGKPRQFRLDRITEVSIMADPRDVGSWWVQLTDGRKGTVGVANGEHRAAQIEALGGGEVIGRLPYPRDPVLRASNDCPSFCYGGRECIGKSSCPQRPSCTS